MNPMDRMDRAVRMEICDHVYVGRLPAGTGLRVIIPIDIIIINIMICIYYCYYYIQLCVLLLLLLLLLLL